MSLYEFIAGIVKVVLEYATYPRAAMTIEIEHASQYSQESRAWDVHVNRAELLPLPYTERFIERIKRERAGLTCPIEPPFSLTLLYSEGAFMLDDL